MIPGKGSVNSFVWHCFLFLVTYSCGRQPDSVATKPGKYNHTALRLEHYHANVYPEFVSKAKSGQIITRMGKDITSILMSKLNPNDSSFSHCGLVNIESDSVFVYHCIGGEWNPGQKMKREWLFHFINPAHSKRAGLFEWEMEEGLKNVLIYRVISWYQSELMFDMDFDLQTNDRMYCTEMLAKAWQFATGNKDSITPVTSDNITFLPVDRIFLKKGTKELLRMEY